MRIKTVTDWVKKHSKAIIKKNGLDDWNIEIDIKGKIKSEKDSASHTLAQLRCVMYEYKVARIWIYANNMPNIEELEKTLQHELFHVILAPYDLFLQSLAKKYKISKTEEDVLYKVFEMAVTALEKRESRR